MMEDFGRFSLVETLDSDTDITDESSDPAYAEENAGARFAARAHRPPQSFRRSCYIALRILA
jgi:hypothetical protein